MGSKIRGTFVVLLLQLSTAGALAQFTSTVQVSGTVTDPTGAVIPGADVSATHIGTGFQRLTTTAVNGSYILQNLPIGPYRLEVMAEGFKGYVREGIVLQVNMNPTINVSLDLGAVAETVKVQANAIMTETRSNSISQVIDERRIIELPLNGRQVTQLILLSGAAVQARDAGFTGSKNYPSSVEISVAGGQANGTYYLMDGGHHMDAFGYVNLPMPFPDAIQEFSVQTSSLPANYGIRGGAVVNIVTKSGTNEFHGGVFHFLRNGATNARNFFAPERDQLKRNQFGATIGGPVARDRLFFFGGYQGMRVRTAPQTNTAFVPTVAMRAGDFSTVTSSACGKDTTLIDPTTGQPFPNNMISPLRLNRESLALLEFVPTSSDPCGTLLYGIPARQDEDQLMGRLDWLQSERHTLFGRYFWTDFEDPPVFDGQNILAASKPGVQPRIHSIVLGDTFTINPTTISNFRFSFSDKHLNRGYAANMVTASDIGLNITSVPGNFPQTGVTGRFSVGCGTCSTSLLDTESFQFTEDVSMVRGKHHIEFGADWIHNWEAWDLATEAAGSYGFNGAFTKDSTADFMLGSPNAFQQGNIQYIAPRQNLIYLYVQDKIRFSPRLSLNLGLRWDPLFPGHDPAGQIIHFDIGSFLAGTKGRRFQNAPAGILHAGNPGIPPGVAANRLGNFAPRTGLVWDISGSGRTVLRISYGIIYEAQFLQNINAFSGTAPFGSTVRLSAPKGGFTNPYQDFPGGNPFPTPFPPPTDAFFPPGARYQSFPRDLRLPYMQQWNLSLQQQVGQSWLFSANYLGNKTTHSWIRELKNPGVYIPGTCGSGPCSTLANTQERRMLALLRPEEGQKISDLGWLDDGGNASYNALLLSANHRFHENFSLLLNYTWSHCISEGRNSPNIFGSDIQDPFNRAADRANCESDVRHLFNASFLVASPRFSGSLAQAVLGNWEFSGIVSKRSGFWQTVSSGRDNSLTAIGRDRPNLVDDPSLDNPTVARWFNTSAFVANPTGQYGNVGRNTLEGPGAFTFDMALVKRFPVGERRVLQVRAEAFNILNHPTFGSPVTGLTNSRFGSILNANDPRILQFALKYSF